MWIVIVLMISVSTTQTQENAFVVDNMPNTFGVGVGISPDYPGSDDYAVGAAPYGRYTFSGLVDRLRLPFLCYQFCRLPTFLGMALEIPQPQNGFKTNTISKTIGWRHRFEPIHNALILY